MPLSEKPVDEDRLLRAQLERARNERDQLEAENEQLRRRVSALEKEQEEKDVVDPGLT